MDTAIVTGGAQGIGKAISLKLMEQGVRVYILDRDAEALHDFSQECGFTDRYRTLCCDVGQVEALQVCLSDIQKESPDIKYLVNNAAIAHFMPMEELSPAQWIETLAVNLGSCFFTVKYLADSLRRNHGAVVHLSSTRALMSEPHSEAYAASKGGVLALTHAQAMSLQPHVRVNAISPGWIDVLSWQKKSSRKTIHWHAKHHQQHPVGRIGQAEDVAELCWFLLSDKAAFITGQNFVADGGMTRKMIYAED